VNPAGVLRNTVLALLMGAGSLVAQAGLDAPVAIGPFLNGVFPSRTPGPTGTWSMVEAFPNLTFVDPVRMVKDPVSAAHMYVVCRNGEIWRVPFSSSATNAQKVRFLDRRANTWGFWDAGMLGLAFHPDFGVPGSPNRGYVYVFYQYVPAQPASPQVGSPSYMRLSRFTVPDGSVAVDPSSEYVLIQQFDRHNWHNGGQMFFGPDRFLYLAIGDEGDANDSFNVCQKIDDRLFSGILRIDVDRDPARSHPPRRQPRAITVPSGWQGSYTQGYWIPDDNPWLDPNGGILEEFWSIGTRSPHSMFHDPTTGEIWIAEVGQAAREEITIARRGGNHQWPFKEGIATGPKAKPANLIGTEVPPVYDYGRTMGGCVIGGMVYRGNLHSGSLTGKYIFGDHNTRAIYSLERRPGQAPVIEFLTNVFRSGGTKRGLAGICEGPDGEPYFLELGDTGTDTGKIYKLARTGTPVADPPALLSQTGAFTSLLSMTPAPGLLPYDVNAPLWTDGADKGRWIAIPNNGTHDTAAERVIWSRDGAWTFPVGTVLVKHFAIPIDDANPNLTRAVETRFFVHGNDGKWYGVTYAWNEAGTDATLLTHGMEKTYTVTGLDGTTRQRVWEIPGRGDCLTCHSSEADNVLGVRTHQLNRELLYSATGRTANQLTTWAQLGIFGTSYTGSPSAQPKAAPVDDPHASLDHRVKSYLDANCAHCHRPGGVSANWDARFALPLAQMGLIDGALARPVGESDSRVIFPGSTELSAIHARASVVGPNQMPPLAKNAVDTKAMEIVADWILSLDRATFESHGTPGIAGEYFTGKTLSTPGFTRTDSTINFSWGSASPGAPLGSDNFSVRWRSVLIPPVTGTYSFHATTDDGTRVTVNGVRIIDAWADQSATERTGTISLAAGVPVSLVMEYYDATGNATARLAWSAPGLAKEIIPASAYRLPDANAIPVANHDTFTVAHGSSAALHPLSNDNDADGPPGVHGITIVNPPVLGSVRVSGAGKQVIYSHHGSAGRQDSFTYTITDPQGAVSSPATVTVNIPLDYPAWKSTTPGAGTGGGSNGDGDFFPDLLEFALGGSPIDGASPGPNELSLITPGGAPVLRVVVPAGLSGVTLIAEASGDLINWKPAPAPVVVSLGNGKEEWTFPNLATVEGVSLDRGFARLKVSATGEPGPAWSLPFGWLATTIGTGTRTYAVPFRAPPVFTSLVTAQSSTLLAVYGTPSFPPGFSGYAEILDGPHAGHRVAVNPTASGPGLLALAPVGAGTTLPWPASLTGTRVSVSPHQTLGSVFDKFLFKGSTNPADADQVQFLLNTGNGQSRFDLFYLLDARPGNPTHQWRAFLPGGGDQGGRIWLPGEGAVVKRPSGVAAARVLATGQVRGNAFRQPMATGLQLVGTGFALPMTPRQRGLLDAGALPAASTNLNAADQFHLLRSGAFRIFYLLDHPTLEDQWRESVAGSGNQNDIFHFSPDEAAFLLRRAPAPLHRIPAPWIP
jgi:uncharacterized repeat protein (TIGR03806 family)